MELPVGITDLISWAITIVAVVLWWKERKKNEEYYMILQGIFGACMTKAKQYYTTISLLRERESKSVPMDEYQQTIVGVASDFDSIAHNISGVMKGLMPKRDIADDPSARAASP